MRDLDLRMDADDESKPAPAPPPAVTPEIVSPRASAPRPTSGDLSEAHEMLLQDLDEVRKAAQLVTERLAAIEAKLAPKEASLATQAQMIERVAREALSESGREWAETAQRFRKFVDDMGSLAAQQQERANKMPAPSKWGAFGAAFLGGLLAGAIAMAMTSSAADRLRAWVGGAATIGASTTMPDAAPAAAPTAKKPGRPGAR
jgi:hypothetical protein